MLATGTFAGMAIIIYRGLDRRTTDPNHGAFEAALFSRVDWLAIRLIEFSKQTLKIFSWFFLFIAHWLVSGFRKLLHRVEDKFSHMLGAVNGHRLPNRNGEGRGAASFFLEQIKLHQDEVSRRARTSHH